jgi:hypothetical protein
MPKTTPRTPPTPPAPTRPSSSAPAIGKPILQVPTKKPDSTAPSSGHTLSIQCHRCHGLGHMKRDCPSQRTYVATDAGYISVSDVEDDDDTSDDAGDDDAIDGDAATSNFWNIIVQCVLSAQPQTSKQQQRHNLFQTFFVIKNRRGCVIIDGGSCNNLVSSDLVKKLSLPTRPRPHPYQIWSRSLA